MWSRLCELEERAARRKFYDTGSFFGYFSTPEFAPTEAIAERLAEINGPVLDIGCGLLAMPNYLRRCHNPYGIDPCLGESRVFPFTQAMGESLPFRDNTFSACLLMSSLDHCYNPHAVLRECWRVLVNDGLLLVWYISRQKPDKHHLWAWTVDGLKELARFGFRQEEFYSYSGNREVGYPRTEMLVLGKVHNEYNGILPDSLR